MQMSRGFSKQQRDKVKLGNSGVEDGLILPDDIPRDIWRNIGKRLESRLDVLRFRSVCRTWRSWLPPPLRFPLKVPRPPVPTKKHLYSPHFITELTFYSANRMILLFEENYRGGKFSAYTFVLKSRAYSVNLELPPLSQISNLSFLCNAYHVHACVQFYNRDNELTVNKYSFREVDVLKTVIICSQGFGFNPNYPRLGDLKVVAHLNDRKLAVLSLCGGAMNNNWETDFCSIRFDDIVNYRGQLYCVDKLGTAFVMDYNSLRITQVAPPALPDFVFSLQRGCKVMHLAVVSEDLYMVHNEPFHRITPRLFKLSSHLPAKWLEADLDLPHLVFILNTQSNFAVARQLFDYDVPRFCSWPDFHYRPVAVGFKDPYLPLLADRGCDHPGLPY